MSQHAFSEALLRPDLPVPEELTDAHGAPAGKRFSVYRNNVIVSLIDALCEGFPVVSKLLGDENMRNIAREYARSHPPTSPLMMLYGAQFADFLEGFEPLAHIPYLADVARLEYTLRKSYHAPDATPIAPTALSAVSPEALCTARLQLAPALSLLRSRWPIFGLWLYNTAENAPKPEARAEAVLITRPEYDPSPTRLGPGGYTFIAALQNDTTLAEAAQQASEAAPEFDLNASLSVLLSTRSITHVKLEVPE